MGPSTSPL
uniref:Uncharacterized protein n=1 Tax=Arundo donax TaxID=35708 RepID=A0A0A8Z0C1_ARUDO